MHAELRGRPGSLHVSAFLHVFDGWRSADEDPRLCLRA
jgi:hypothetical protein